MKIAQYIQDLKDAQVSKRRIREGYQQQSKQEQNPTLQSPKRERRFGEIVEKTGEYAERIPQRLKPGAKLQGKDRVTAALSGRYSPEFLTRNPFAHSTITFKEEPKGTGKTLNDEQPKGNSLIHNLGADNKTKRRSPFL
jgi:hypothetical protein